MCPIAQARMYNNSLNNGTILKRYQWNSQGGIPAELHRHCQDMVGYYWNNGATETETHKGITWAGYRNLIGRLNPPATGKSIRMA